MYVNILVLRRDLYFQNTQLESEKFLSFVDMIKSHSRIINELSVDLHYFELAYLETYSLLQKCKHSSTSSYLLYCIILLAGLRMFKNKYILN